MTRPGDGTNQLSLTYPAHLEHIDTGEPVLDVAMLAQCDGIAERTDLAWNLLPDDLSTGIKMLQAVPTLRFERESGGLVLEIAARLDRAPAPRDIEDIAAFFHRQMIRGWGLNYEFDLPESLEDYQVHFALEPREPIPTPSHDELAALARDIGEIDGGALAAMSEAELEALIARLEPHAGRLRDRTAGGVAGQLGNLYRSALARRQQRSIDRLEIPKVTLDNLDALDDLPDDVF